MINIADGHSNSFEEALYWVRFGRWLLDVGLQLMSVFEIVYVRFRFLFVPVEWLRMLNRCSFHLIWCLNLHNSLSLISLI
jgi:hypothetical protein